MISYGDGLWLGLCALSFGTGYAIRWFLSPVRYRVWKTGPDVTRYVDVERVTGVCAKCATVIHPGPVNVEVWNNTGQQLLRVPVSGNLERVLTGEEKSRLGFLLVTAVDLFNGKDVTDGSATGR